MRKPTVTPELVGFFKVNASREKNPIHKLAIIGVSGFERFWLHSMKGILWPKNAAFFMDYEEAKDWLVGEKFLVLIYFVVSHCSQIWMLQSANYATSFDGRQIHSACALEMNSSG